MAFGISATALAIGGSALIGAYAANRSSSAQQQSAGEATQAQRDIADQQTALQREQYLKQLELNAPFREAGLDATNKLRTYLGLSTAKFDGVPGYDPASAMRNFGASDFQADPGYAFRLSEGMKALDRTAAARGGLLSGATLKGAQRYGSDLASQEYQNAFNRYQANRAAQEQAYGNAFNRYQTERINTIAPLQSLAGVGQSAAQQAQQASQNFATSGTNTLGAFGVAQGSNIIGAGNARASGYVGGANALSSGLGQGLNFYQNQNLVNTLLANRGGGGGGGGYIMPEPYSYGGADAYAM